jgi:hypothetical protein
MGKVNPGPTRRWGEPTKRKGEGLMRITVRAVQAAAVAALAVLAVGCGSDSDAGGTANASSTR